MQKSVNFRWDSEWVAELDERRGLVSRSAYVRAAVDAFGGDVRATSAGFDPAPTATQKAAAASLPRTRPKTTLGGVIEEMPQEMQDSFINIPEDL